MIGTEKGRILPRLIERPGPSLEENGFRGSGRDDSRAPDLGFDRMEVSVYRG